MASNTKSLALVATSSQYAYRVDGTLLSLTASLTLEGWFYFDTKPATDTRYQLFNKFDTADAKRSFSCSLINSADAYQLNFIFSPSGSYVAGDDTYVDWTPTEDTWYHIAFVFDGSAKTVKIYVNGSQVGTTNSVTDGTIYDNDLSLYIGSYNGVANYFNGLVDDLRVWNVARSESDINTYKALNIDPATSGLVAYWKFEDNANDSTSNALNLTLSGTPSYSATKPTIEDSASNSASPSGSPSNSPSGSPSNSPSASPSGSPSNSPSGSPSNSPSASPSGSPSGSPSNSPSNSPSASPYPTENYSKGDYVLLPADDTDLETTLTGQQQRDVATDDNVFVTQNAVDEYAIFEFKNQHDNNTDVITLTWKGKSDNATSDTPALLQIYNRNSALWETVATNNNTNAGTEFTLTGVISTNLSNYYDGSYWVSCRVYQQAI